MAITLSRSRVAPIMVKTEAAYNDGSTTPTGGTDDVLSYDSPVPIASEFTFLDLRPHGTSATWVQGIPTQRSATLVFKTMFAGSGSAGGVTANGFTALAAALGACGVVTETAAGTPTKIRLRPASMAEWQARSIVAFSDHNGQVHKFRGSYGNVTFTGTPDTSFECAFSLMGLYTEPAALGSEFSGWTGGTQRAKAFLGIGGTVTPLGGSAYTGVIESVTWNHGAQAELIKDCNASTGIWGALNIDKNPTLTLQIAQDNTGTNLTYANIHSHLTASTVHAFSFTYGSGTGNTATFTFPALQLRNVRPSPNGGHRSVSLEYKLTGSSADSEWYCYIA